MKTCKFCGVLDGSPDRRGDRAHINNTGLCAACYYVLERVKYQPEKLDEETLAWFDEMCSFNFKNGMFVPVAQRRVLRTKQQWACKDCGEIRTYLQDPQYKSYCVVCADNHRRGADKTKRKARSDRRVPRGPRNISK